VNLWEPADDRDGHDFGAHGIYDRKAASRSYQLWASRHHGLVGVAVLAAGALGAALVRATRR
jgi:hypothetical protein